MDRFFFKVCARKASLSEEGKSWAKMKGHFNAMEKRLYPQQIKQPNGKKVKTFAFPKRCTDVKGGSNSQATSQ